MIAPTQLWKLPAVAPTAPPAATLEKLYIDMIPSLAWTVNLRTQLPRPVWKTLQSHFFKLANYQCQCCQNKGRAHPVELHERFSYDMKLGIQKLEKLVVLCPDCHQATHYGLATVRGKEAKAKSQLMLVNGWDAKQVHSHITSAFATWHNRSQRKDWALDMTWLLTCGVEFTPETVELIKTFRPTGWPKSMLRHRPAKNRAMADAVC